MPRSGPVRNPHTTSLSSQDVLFNSSIVARGRHGACLNSVPEGSLKYSSSLRRPHQALSLSLSRSPGNHSREKACSTSIGQYLRKKLHAQAVQLGGRRDTTLLRARGCATKCVAARHIFSYLARIAPQLFLTAPCVLVMLAVPSRAVCGSLRLGVIVVGHEFCTGLEFSIKASCTANLRLWGRRPVEQEAPR